MDMEAWEQTVPEGIRGDALWRRQDYRLAAFVADRSWPDVHELAQHAPTRDLSAQLYDALGSIPAHLSEGYSRGSAADRVKFYEYALGSAREAREWYSRARPVIGTERVAEQQGILTSIIRLLLTIIPAERKRKSGPAGMRSMRDSAHGGGKTSAPTEGHERP